jgi:uncharacterized membrane protein YqjE
MAEALSDRLRKLAGHLCALASNRIALFGLEWQEETARLFGYLALLLGVALLAGFALAFAALALLVLAWKSGCLLLVCGVGALVLGLAAVLGAWVLQRRLKEASPPFAVSSAEFERDRQILTGRREREA